MAGNVKTVFQHGWGTDSGFWRGFEKFFPNPVLLERGYFQPEFLGTEIIQTLASDSRLIGVTHSFGLHLLKKELALFDELWIFSGFASIYSDRGVRNSTKTLKVMQEKLERFPEDTLKRFLEIAYRPGSTPDKRLNLVRPDRLKQDFQLLLDSSLDPDCIRDANRVVFVHGEEDWIVPIELGRSFSGKVPGSFFISVPQLGHCFDFGRVEALLMRWREEN